jgi:hypothetical protein
MTSVKGSNTGNWLNLERNIRAFSKADLSIQELENLAEGHDPEGRVEKLFDWSFERRKVVAQAALAFIASFLIAMSVPYFKNEFTSQVFVPIVIVSVGGVSALFVHAYWRLRSLKQEYLAALWIINELKR